MKRNLLDVIGNDSLMQHTLSYLLDQNEYIENSNINCSARVFHSPILPLVLSLPSVYRFVYKISNCTSSVQLYSQVNDFIGSPSMVDWIRSMGCAFDPGNDKLCMLFAKNGDIKGLEWARSLPTPYKWSSKVCSVASKCGNVEVLKWLRNQDPPCPWGFDTTCRAAEADKLDILVWLRAQDPPCPWDSNTCCEAARNGNLEVLKWLRAQDPPCPWDSNTCCEAARNGHINILLWSRSQVPPCPWDSTTSNIVARYGNADVFESVAMYHGHVG